MNSLFFSDVRFRLQKIISFHSQFKKYIIFIFISLHLINLNINYENPKLIFLISKVNLIKIMSTYHNNVKWQKFIITILYWMKILKDFDNDNFQIFAQEIKKYYPLRKFICILKKLYVF